MLKQMKSKRSLGFDGISPLVVKRCASVLTIPLTHCMNKLFEQFRFPDILKISKVVPIPKKGSRFELDNFRGISIVTPFAKLFETAMSNRLANFLETHDFIFNRQFAYRKRSSTTSCVVEVSDRIFNALDRGLAVTGIFLDLSKAFDLVDHEVLLRKLECYGVRGRVNDLFRSYLCERRQYVEVNGMKSGTRLVQRGVPQGSCLGPLLYLTYTNDMARLSLAGTLFNFADDGALLYESEEYDMNCESASADALILEEYLRANGQQLSLEKTTVIHLKRRRDSRPIMRQVVCEGQVITEVTWWRYLGLTLDHFMTMRDHVEQILSVCRPWISFLYRMNRFVTRSMLLSLFHSMVQSKISYLIQVWSSCGEGMIDKVQVMQNSALRAIFGLDRRASRVDMFRSVARGILPVRGMREQAIQCFVFMAMHGDIYTNVTFQYGMGQNARRNKLLAVPRVNRQSGESAIACIGPRLFNSLPLSIRESPTLKIFMSGCREFNGGRIENWLR